MRKGSHHTEASKQKNREKHLIHVPETRTCPVCGDVRESKPWQTTDYCSIQCFNKRPNQVRSTRGKPSWNKGLTKETDARVAKYSNNRTYKPTESTRAIWRKQRKGRVSFKKGKTNEETFGEEKAAKIRENASKAACKRYENSPESVKCGRGKNGYIVLNRFGKFWYRSSWEEGFLLIVDKNLDIVAIEANKPRILYLFKGGEHRYLPDFLLTTLDGKKHLVEIKPDYKLKDPQTVAKIEAGRKYAVENSINYFVWDREICLDPTRVSELLK